MAKYPARLSYRRASRNLISPFLPRQEAFDYYVDATDGDDSNDGTSEAEAWKTISKVNAASFSAGDRIGFKRGELWREQLTVPSSGESGAAIVFGRYGSGAAPVINGADIVTGWTEATTWTTAWSDTLGSSGNAAGTARQRRQVISAGDISIGGDTIRVTVKAGSGRDAPIIGTSIGGRSGSTEDFSAAPTRVTWDGGNSGVTVGAGAEKVSDEISFTLNPAVDHLFHYYMSPDYSYAYVSSGGAGSYNDGTIAGDETLTQDVDYGLSAGYGFFINKIEVQTAANVWQATLTTEPNQVFFDGIKGTNQASAAACTSANDWFWDSNVLYVYSATDPDTAYADPGVEASVRSRCIDLNEKNGITISGIHVTKSNGPYFSNIDEYDTSGAARTNIVIKNVESSWSYWMGMRLYFSTGTVAGLLIDSCYVHDSGSDNVGSGIRVHGTAADQFSGVVITNNHTADNAAEGIAFGYGSGLIANNHSEHDGYNDTEVTSGIYIMRYAKNISVYANLVDDPAAEGVFVDGRDTTGMSIHYNIVVDAVDAGITVAQSCDGVKILNNVFWAVDNGIRLGSTAQVTNAVLKNNLMDGGLSAANIQVLNGSTYTSDYNCFDESAAWPFDVAGVNTNWATWTGLGNDANSYFESADMVDPANGDFTLQATSPCRNAGDDVSLTEDYAGVSVPQETNPAIGAYEYTG